MCNYRFCTKNRQKHKNKNNSRLNDGSSLNNINDDNYIPCTNIVNIKFYIGCSSGKKKKK